MSPPFGCRLRVIVVLVQHHLAAVVANTDDVDALAEVAESLLFGTVGLLDLKQKLASEIVDASHT